MELGGHAINTMMSLPMHADIDACMLFFGLHGPKSQPNLVQLERTKYL